MHQELQLHLSEFCVKNVTLQFLGLRGLFTHLQPSGPGWYRVIRPLEVAESWVFAVENCRTVGVPATGRLGRGLTCAQPK